MNLSCVFVLAKKKPPDQKPGIYWALFSSPSLGAASYDLASSSSATGAGGAYRSIADERSEFDLNPAGISRNPEERSLFLEGGFLFPEAMA